MPTVKYITHDGVEYDVDVKAGASVMEGAVKNNVPGIDADCGGACACATCHVYVDETWWPKCSVRSAGEQSLLEFVDGYETNSRLSCQMQVSDDLDGLIVRLPESQQ